MTRSASLMIRMNSRHGSALIIVLWSLVLLSMGAVSVLYGTRVDLRVAKNVGDRTKARFLALAAIEKAKAVLYRESEQQKRSGEAFSAVPYDSPADFREQKLGAGEYQVIRAPRADEPARSSTACSTWSGCWMRT